MLASLLFASTWLLLRTYTAPAPSTTRPPIEPAAMAAWMSGDCPSAAADGPMGKSETLSEQADQRNAPSAMAARAAAPCVMRGCVTSSSRLEGGGGGAASIMEGVAAAGKSGRTRTPRAERRYFLRVAAAFPRSTSPDA